MHKTKWLPFLRLIAGALIIELTVCNFSAWKSLFYQNRLLYENVRTEGGEENNGGFTAPDGTLTLCLENIDKPVHDLYIACDFSETSPVSYTVSLTDEGNYYPYDLPEQVLLPSLSRSYYTCLYPAGRVKTVSVRLNIPAGSTVTVHGIGINARIPFLFSPVRLLVILGVISLLYCLTHTDCRQWQTCGKSARQRVCTVVTVLLLIGMSWALSHINPLCVAPIWPHHRQYQELAEAMTKGQFCLDAKPSEGLMNAENPYDTIYLQANGIDYLADYVYYDGKYYVYFGVVPELLLYLPMYLLTGRHMPNHIAVFLFYCGFIAAVFALCRQLVRKWFPRTPYCLYLLICILTVCCGNYLFIIARPDLYNVPIMAANMFTVAGLAFWIRGTDTASKNFRAFLLFLGSLCMALVAGCRPQMLLFSFLAIPLFWTEFVRPMRSGHRTADALCIGLPYAIVAAFIMYYNAARFGSPFDFGAAYSLTSNDMTRRSFNLHQTLLGLWHYLFSPPVITSDFPFLQGTQITSSSYMGKLNAEYTYGGVLTGNVFLWVLFSMRRIKDSLREKKILILTVMSAVIPSVLVIVDVTFAGILQRYMTDMIWGFCFAATVLTLAWIEKAADRQKLKTLSTVLGVICLLQAAYGFGIILGNGNMGTNIRTCNPELYFYIRALVNF